MDHIVITGGGSGIGLAIAQALYADGHRLTLLGRDIEKLKAAQEAMPKVEIATCDVSDPQAVTTTFKQLDGITGLINNAGSVEPAPFERLTLEDWHRCFAVNLFGAISCIQACLHDIKSAPHGRIINIASTASLKAYAYVSAYVSAKHALLGLTRSLALELSSTNVTVNAVCPGYTDTEIMEKAVGALQAKTGQNVDDALKSFTRMNPQGRLVEPDEVANAVLWLMSPGARSITGQSIAIAGGEVM